MKKKFLIPALLFLLSVSTYGQNNPESLPSSFPKGSFILRTNVAYWATVTPNLGVEYRFSDNYSLLADGTWSHWDWKDDSRRWRNWSVSPQIRRYVGALKDSYIGLAYNVGEYNLNLSDIGKQASFMGGSLTLGHQFYAGNNLLVDIGLSGGYLHIYKKDKYEHINGVDVSIYKDRSHGYWGLTGFNLSFVWKIN